MSFSGALHRHNFLEVHWHCIWYSMTINYQYLFYQERGQKQKLLGVHCKRSIKTLATSVQSDKGLYEINSKKRATWLKTAIAYLGFAEASHTEEALVIVNGHNTRNNGACYSNLTTIIHKFEEIVSVIEKLSNNEICTSIHLKNNCSISTRRTNRGFKSFTSTYE